MQITYKGSLEEICALAKRAVAEDYNMSTLDIIVKIDKTQEDSKNTLLINNKILAMQNKIILIKMIRQAHEDNAHTPFHTDVLGTMSLLEAKIWVEKYFNLQ